MRRPQRPPHGCARNAANAAIVSSFEATVMIGPSFWLALPAANDVNHDHRRRGAREKPKRLALFRTIVMCGRSNAAATYPGLDTSARGIGPSVTKRIGPPSVQFATWRPISSEHSRQD